MDEERLEMRIRVVVVTTRAAVRSLRRDTDGQVQAAIERGLALLDGVELDANGRADPEKMRRLGRARQELVRLVDAPSG